MSSTSRPLRRAIRSLLPPRAVDIIRYARGPAWAYANLHDNETMRAVIRACVSRKGALVDVGASWGDIFSAAVEAAPDVSHIAIEPLPRAVDHLRRAFPDATVICACAAEDAGHTTFYEYERDTRSSMTEVEGQTLLSVHEVATVRVDEVTPPELDVRVIKVDVEGHELEVLRGSRNLLVSRHPALLLEHGSPEGAEDLESIALFQLLRDAEYQVYGLRGERFTTADAFAHAAATGTTWNFLASAS